MTATRFKPIRTPVAVRRLREPGTGQVIVLRIDRPRRSGRDWVCWFELSGGVNSRIGRAYGVDGVQALFLVFRAIRKEVENRGYSWVGLPAELGFPRCADGVDLQTLRSAEQALDRTMERWAKRMIERHGKASSKRTVLGASGAASRPAKDRP
jgi:hypothetical protein